MVAEEERRPAAPADLGTSFAIVDPLDGTKEFIAGRDEFTVNLAIVTRGVPVAGIIAAPAQGLLWRGVPAVIARSASACAGPMARSKNGADASARGAAPPRADGRGVAQPYGLKRPRPS